MGFAQRLAAADRPGDAVEQASAPRREVPAQAQPATQLERLCRQTAQSLAADLGPRCRVAVRDAFVLAGDLDAEELDRLYDHTIAPAAQAMALRYFTTPPTEPVTVLLFASRDSYEHYCRALFGDSGVSVYGYYKPNLRTLV